jgi:hypothetical protein
MHDMRVRLSTLWLFAVLNYLYADIVTLMDPAFLGQFIAGRIGAMRITEWFLLGAAALLETAIAMVLLSRVLKYSANRWANILIGILHTMAVLSSLFLGDGRPAIYYVFFATIEIACTSLIVWFAWRWKPAGTLAPSG